MAFEGGRSAVPSALCATPVHPQPSAVSPGCHDPCSSASPPAPPPCDRDGSPDRSCSHASRSSVSGRENPRHLLHCRRVLGPKALLRCPGLDQSPIHRKMLVRQKRLHLRVIQKLRHELLKHLAVL